MALLPLSIVLLLMSLLHTESKVIDNKDEWMKCCEHCKWEWPYGKTQAAICQYYEDKAYYATLYDTANRIPVFSQFSLEGAFKRPGKRAFRIEPGLIIGAKNMDLISKVSRLASQFQQNENDYKQIKNETKYDKGHLNPSSGHPDEGSCFATYTLTNAVPQLPTFNQVCWNYVENVTHQYVKKSCSMQNTVAVGAVPGFEKMNQRVNIPSYMWSYIQCLKEQKIVGFLVPTDIGPTEKKMVVFYFKADKLPQFVQSIKSLYGVDTKKELNNRVNTIKNNDAYFTLGTPDVLSRCDPIKKYLCECQEPRNNVTEKEEL